jgi:O-antigen ligase
MEESLQHRSDWTENTIRRLRFTGLMDGPNEVAVFLSVLTFLCGYQFNNKKIGLARFLWLVPIGLFLFCIFLTRSRGGLLALLAGLVVFAIYASRQANAPALAASAAPPRKSPIMSILLLACVIPMLLLVGGRQTEISTNTNTAQTRFGTWSDWLLDFRYNPIIGVGPRLGPRADRDHAAGLEDRLLAHNSFLQAFADLGFAGGLSFLGVVGFCFVTLSHYGPNKTIILDADLARLHPYLMAALVCCSVGFMTLSINYFITVFFVFAIPVAYYGMTPCFPPIKPPEITFAALAWLVVASIGFLAVMYVVVRVMPKQ